MGMARMPYPPIMLHKYGETVLFYIDLRVYIMLHKYGEKVLFYIDLRV